MLQQAITVMVSPFDAGHRSWRMGAGPERLMAAGLVEALSDHDIAVDEVWIEPSVDVVPSELRIGFAVQRQIAAATAAACTAGRFPLLLAGNCNSSLGVVAGLQGCGLAPGFVWCDAHADFHTPETDQSGSLDCQGLSMLTGRAWQDLVRQTGLHPVPDSQVALVGARAVDRAEAQALSASGIARLDVTDVGDARARGRVLRGLAAPEVSGLHLHIDADVLDPSVVPANDYAAPGGLQPQDLTTLAADAATVLPITSLSIASYDPRLDDGSLANALVATATGISAMSSPADRMSVRPVKDRSTGHM